MFGKMLSALRLTCVTDVSGMHATASDSVLAAGASTQGVAVPDPESLVTLDLKDQPPLTLRLASAKGDLGMTYKVVLNFYIL